MHKRVMLYSLHLFHRPFKDFIDEAVRRLISGIENKMKAWESSKIWIHSFTPIKNIDSGIITCLKLLIIQLRVTKQHRH